MSSFLSGISSAVSSGYNVVSAAASKSLQKFSELGEFEQVALGLLAVGPLTSGATGLIGKVFQIAGATGVVLTGIATVRASLNSIDRSEANFKQKLQKEIAAQKMNGYSHLETVRPSSNPYDEPLGVGQASFYVADTSLLRPSTRKIASERSPLATQYLDSRAELFGDDSE